MGTEIDDLGVSIWLINSILGDTLICYRVFMVHVTSRRTSFDLSKASICIHLVSGCLCRVIQDRETRSSDGIRLLSFLYSFHMCVQNRSVK